MYYSKSTNGLIGGCSMDKYAKVSEIDLYWNSVKNLGKDVKLALIAKLSNSLLDNQANNNAKEGWTKEFRGMWNDDTRSTDEIIDDIRQSRTFTRTVESW